MDALATQEASFIRRWWALILLGIIVVTTLVGWRMLTDHLVNASVIEPYSEIIQAFSLQSPLAHERLETYYTKHQRRTVASKHYPRLCEQLQRLAARDGIVVRLGPGRKVSACPEDFDTDEEP